MAYNNRPQYNNNYPKRNYASSSTDSKGGTAKLLSTKKDGCILVVTLDNQNLVLKGFYLKIRIVIKAQKQQLVEDGLIQVRILITVLYHQIGNMKY